MTTATLTAPPRIDASHVHETFRHYQLADGYPGGLEPGVSPSWTTRTAASQGAEDDRGDESGGEPA